VSDFSLGIDVGSSSIKAALLETSTGKVLGTSTSPEREMSISAPQPGWAEQDPDEWWSRIVSACGSLIRTFPHEMQGVKTVGLSYQEHGLVLTDSDGKVLRPSIIWCDGRAVSVGEELFHHIGTERCFSRLANSPGNFTASKLAWVYRYEPEVLKRARKILLPGDYIAYRMTGEAATTRPGLSEGILYDYSSDEPATFVMDAIGADQALLPRLVETFGPQGNVTASTAAELGISPNAIVSYRAGDQHSNALGLSVLSAGQAAVTAGTSGVIYAVTDRVPIDRSHRVNTFLHVNHSLQNPRYSVVMCVNGAAISYRWMRDLLGRFGNPSYPSLNQAADEAFDDAGDLFFYPFGNGAERTLGNRNAGASFVGIDFNRHSSSDILWAVLTGVAFAMRFGATVLSDIGVSLRDLKAGNANLFLYDRFARMFASTMGLPIELYESEPAAAAARGAAYGDGTYGTLEEALSFVQRTQTVDPDVVRAGYWNERYETWVARMGTT
jgi:xylulokinase